MTPRLSKPGHYDTLVVMTTFTSDDGDLHYRDTGTGRPLVLLHSGFADGTQWDDVVPRLARDHRVIVPDARGHGASANATRPFRTTDDLAALLRHLDCGPAALVGVSMGAMTAFDTALEHPDLVRALVLCGGGATLPGFEDPWTAKLSAAAHGALAAADLPAWFDAFLQWAAGPERAPAEVAPAVVERLRAMAARTLAKHFPGEPDHRVAVTGGAERAAEIRVPVLALNGDLDSPDFVERAELVARAAPGGRCATVPGTAHYPNMERPDDFCRAVEDFLRTAGR